ncbi:cell division cycle-associated protein 2 isoform X2 [Stigmatopora argus]
MGTEDLAVVDEEMEQRDTMFPSLEKESGAVLGSPIDFLRATPSQFGISVKTFNPSSAERKEKSRLAQLRERRKSNIGVRGSPEMNSLIRFMARQKMKNSPNCPTPELVSGSTTFLPRVASTLKQKIASFHKVMGVEESEACDLMPMRANNTGKSINTRDFLSDEYNEKEEEKENQPQVMSPAPNKRRRVGPFDGCQVQIREANTSHIHFNESYKRDDEKVVEGYDMVSKELLRSKKTEEETSGHRFTPRLGHLEASMSTENDFSSQNNQQDNEIEPERPSPAQRRDLTSAWPVKSLSVFQFSNQPAMEPAEERRPSGSSPTATKKKRVHFGCPLSPELFDNQLPPSTPLRKGGTPARSLTPGGILKMHSVLKTPQGDGYCTPPAQPEPISDLGASPLLKISHGHRMSLRVEEDAREQLEKIMSPPTEDNDSEVMTDTESINYAQVNLNEAFHKAPLSPEETAEMKSETSQTSQRNSPNEFLPSSEEKQPEAVSGATARLRKRGKKLPEERKPVRRSTRSAAKPPETIKFTSKAANRWKKEVNHSLYGSREYASKKPVLSPITELFNFDSAAAQHTSPMTCTDIKNEPGESTSGGPKAAVSKEHSPTRPPLMPKKGGVGKKRRSSRYEVTRWGFKKVSASVGDVCEEPQLAECESREEQIATISALSEEAPPEKAPAGEEQHSHTLTVDSAHTDTNAEYHHVEDASTPVCPLVEEQTSEVSTPSSRTRNQPSQNVSRRKRRFANPPDEEPKQEENMVSTSDSAEESTQVNSCPPFCEADFNFEDVFKRVPSRGRRSVRRSLRNQINSSDDTGLAWVPQTSPEYKNGTGKTRGRRSSSAPSEDAPHVTL